MKQYLKMADVFVHDSVDELEQHIYAGYMSKHCSEYAAHAINSHDELVQMNKELLAVVNNFRITDPDEDGCVWLVLNGNGTTGMAMFNLGNEDRIAVKTALHLESDRWSAIAKAKGQ